MHLRRKDLLEALKLVAPATKRGQSPITHCVNLHDAAGALRVTATDMDLTIQAEVGSNGIFPATIVPHTPLVAFVANAGDELELEVDDDGLHVGCNGSALTLRTMPADDFPQTYVAEGEPAAVAAEQAQAIGRCLYAASRDTARPVLTGVGIVDGWAVCTDSYRLSAVELDTELPSSIIPAHVIEQVLKNTDIGFGLVVDGHRASFFSHGVAVWTTRLIEGQFPDWQRLVGTPSGKFECERADLLGALDQVDIFGADYVRLSSDDGRVRLTTKGDAGEVSAHVNGSISVDLSFTLRYLEDMVKATESDLFSLALEGPTKPVVIGSLDSGRVDLLMPVRG